MHRLVTKDQNTNNIQETFQKNFNVDLDKSFESMLTYSGTIEFTKKFPLLHNTLIDIGNIMDQKLGITVNPFTLYENDILKPISNYYQIFNPVMTIKNAKTALLDNMIPRIRISDSSLVKNDDGSEVAQVKMRKDKDDELQIAGYEFVNTSVQEQQKALKNYLYSFEDENKIYEIMQHQINKTIISNCFIQDILYDLYISNRYSDPQFQNVSSYKSGSILTTKEIIQLINNCNKKPTEVPFTIKTEITKNNAKISPCGYNYILTYLTHPELHELYKYEKPERQDATYQNIETINRLFKEKHFQIDIIDSQFLAEKTLGFNLSFHLYSFFSKYKSDQRTIDYIKKIVPIILQYPNTYTRLFMLDEILCFIGNESPYSLDQLDDIIYSVLTEAIGILTTKYEAMKDVIYYVLNKLSIKENFQLLKTTEITEKMFSFYYKSPLPWNITSFDGLIMNSSSAKAVQNQFSGTIPSNDGSIRFYKSIMNTVIKEAHTLNLKKISQ